MKKPQEIWNAFRVAFEQSLDEVAVAGLQEIWGDIKTKTTFYYNDFMPRLEKKLSLHLICERLRCDFTFQNENGVPLIVAETENYHTTATHELDVLCSLAAPVKVLILSCDWKNSQRDIWLPKWSKCIREHHSLVSVECLYIIIVGEWDTQDGHDFIRYSFTVLDNEGTPQGADTYHRVADRPQDGGENYGTPPK